MAMPQRPPSVLRKAVSWACRKALATSWGMSACAKRFAAWKKSLRPPSTPCNAHCDRLLDHLRLPRKPNARSPGVSFYNASAGPFSKALLFNMVWRTHVLQVRVFIMPAWGLIRKRYFYYGLANACFPDVCFMMLARGRIQKQQVLIWFGEHTFSK